VANNAVEISGGGMGNICVNLLEGAKIIQGVSYVPNSSANLLSLSKTVEKYLVVVFVNEGRLIYHKDDCKIKGNVRATASHINGVFELDECKKEKLSNGKSQIAVTMMTTKDASIWHKRLGHISYNNMQNAKDITDGVLFEGEYEKPCIAFAQGKLCKKQFKLSQNRATDLLELAHSDLVGPMEVPLVSGMKYILTFVDDCSRKIFVYYLKHKSDVVSKFKDFKTFAENQTGKRLKILRTDMEKSMLMLN
jgi:hypothetical protein